MSGISLSRVLLGGLVAGLVANIFDFVITTYLMATEFDAMLARMNLENGLPPPWLAVFGILNFLWGVVLVFTYAAIRPRFGAGPQSAVISGVLLWMVVTITLVLLIAFGLHSPASFAKSASLYLVSAIVSSVAGAALYREQVAI